MAVFNTLLVTQNGLLPALKESKLAFLQEGGRTRVWLKGQYT